MFSPHPKCGVLVFFAHLRPLAPTHTSPPCSLLPSSSSLLSSPLLLCSRHLRSLTSLLPSPFFLIYVDACWLHLGTKLRPCWPRNPQTPLHSSPKTRLGAKMCPRATQTPTLLQNDPPEISMLAKMIQEAFQMLIHLLIDVRTDFEVFLLEAHWAYFSSVSHPDSLRACLTCQDSAWPSRCS